MKHFLIVILALLLLPVAVAQQQVQPINGVLTFDLSHGNVSFKVILTGSVSSVVFNLPQQQSPQVTIIFTQDSTGGRTVTFGGNITATNCTVSTTASATSVCQFVFDSSNNQWTAVGGGGGAIPGQFSVKASGAVGDAKKSVTTTLTNTQNNITDTANPFLATDVGKFIFCIFPGDGTTRLAVGTKISTFVNAGSITVSANATGTGAHNCIWYTQKETTAFRAAGTAALSSLASAPPYLGPALGYNATVVCPPGGYVVDGVWLSEHFASLQQGVNFAGSRSGCTLYQSPDITATNSNLHIDLSQVVGVDVGNFTLDCSFEALALAAAPMRFANTQFSHIHDITLASCGTNNDNSGKFFLTSFTNSVVEQIYDNGGSVGNTEPTIGCASGCGGNVFRNVISTNPGLGPTFAIASGGHTQTGGFNTIINGIGDEGSTTGPLIVTLGSDVQVIGTTLFAGTTTEVSVDGTSTVRLEDVNLVPFAGSCGVGQTRNAITIASGGIVTATNSTIQGCGATGAISGPAGATFVDIGGNDIRNCPAAGGSNPCPLVTAANFATLGYSGGIVPTTSLTHTYPQPFLSALPTSGTAQNIVAFTPSNSIIVKNFTITASNTPTCATPPTFQISNGTQSFTQTFASAAQISGPFTPALTLFPAGTQVTLSITTAAYSCTTAPTNMNWSIEWESANSF